MLEDFFMVYFKSESSWHDPYNTYMKMVGLEDFFMVS